MSKYIDVDVFIKSFREALPGLKAQVDPDLTPKAYAYLRGGEAIIEDLTKFPTADVAEVRHGRWEKQSGLYSCSECGMTCPYDVQADVIEYWACNYCPNCGAKIDKEEE